MTRYVIRRLLLLLLTILLTSFVIFALTELLPGDVARLVLGRDASPTAIANFNEEFGLDDPALQRYLNWLGGFVTADWGLDRKSTRLNSSHSGESRMPSSA